ncbi:hypothetical protein BOX15_Mlig023152g1 [Macrostomum lignano]|uniref:RNA-directed DNA polymerase n=1 Tax=Macrostomum lignano TaxID=282301 RepID=A0A267H4F5_9PLAT|nr:hypothetical protein BOX15_Mlig023152g1 [Macrostomum lignano]
MASQAERQSHELNLDDADMAEAWMQRLSATARIKKLTDSDEARDKTDLFLSKAGLQAIRTLSLMAAPKKLDEMKFDDIKKLVDETIRPKKSLVIAERTRFLSLKQESSETVIAYYRRLRAATSHCEFEKLGSKQTKEDDMITMRLIDGLNSSEHKKRILERLQNEDGETPLDRILQNLQQLEQIRDYNTPAPADIAFAGQQRGVSSPAKPQPSIKCGFCGANHLRGNCPAYGKKCSKCQKRNHFAAVCRSRAVHQEIAVDAEEADVYTLSPNRAKAGLFKTIKINGQGISMQVDTGTEISLIPQNLWRQLGRPNLRKCRRILRQFDGSSIACLGEFTASLETNSKFVTIDLVVTAAEKKHGLLGMDNIKLQEDAVTINAVQQLGCLKGFKAKIRLVEGAKAFYCAARSVPLHLRDLVVRELQRMESEGIIEAVPPGGSQWASPIVNVLKPNGKVRVCADFKAGVNHQICNDTYPIPEMETIFSEIAGMSHFSKLDLSDAYLQIELDEDSREVTTIATPLGLFRYKRLVPGLKSASAIFQKAMETILQDVSNKIVYQDDVLLGAKSNAELRSKVQHVLQTMRTAGMTINLEKSNLSATEVRFLGYSISASGITPDPNLVGKIRSVNSPKDRKQLESFLGLSNFFGRFIKNYSDVIEPLNQLRGRNVEFVWGPAQEAAFTRIKDLLCSEPVIKPYDKHKETTLTTDASEKAIGAILSQGNHPIMYFSRKLSSAEAGYSNIEREALAIVWAMERAKQFLLGSRFTLRTDHRPLEFIFGSRRQLPKVANARLLRWAIELMAFDYDIVYTKGESIPQVDALSRLDFEGDSDTELTERPESIIHWTGEAVIPWQELKSETQRDRLLLDVMKRVAVNRWSNCSPAERPFKAIRHALTTDDGVLCYGDRPVIPAVLLQGVLGIVHDTHQGSGSTRARLQNSAWWPGYCSDVEAYVRGCPTCSRLRPSGLESVHRWPDEEKPWHRVHMDHACVPRVGLLLILVDAMSGWPEAVRVQNRDAATVKRVLQTIFARNGVPHVLVSDNAAEFHDANLIAWLERIGCRAIKTPPRHPQSNGLAERMVQSIKRASAAWDQSESYESFLSRVLLNYRCVPHAGRQQSPSQLMGRQLRNPITMRTPIGASLWYTPGDQQRQERAEFVVQKGTNTALIARQGGRIALAQRIS